MGEPEDGLARWKEPAAEARDLAETTGSRDNRLQIGESLMRFLAETQALILALEKAAPDPLGRNVDDIIREEVELLGDGAPPPVASIEGVAAALWKATVDIDDLLPALAGRGDGTFADGVLASAGTSLPRALATKLVAEVLFDGLVGLADAFASEFAAIRPTRSLPVEGLPSGSASPPHMDDDVAWCALGTPDWAAAERAIEESKAPDIDELRADLKELREIVEDDQRFPRYENSMEIGDCAIWLTSRADEGWRRLGRSGILDALGALGWG